MKNFVFEEIEVGEELGPHEYFLAAPFVQKYCAAIDSTCPWQIREASSLIRIVPPTLLGNLSFRLLETKFYRQAGTVHAGQEFEFFYPIPWESKLLSRGKILDKYIKRAKQWVVYEAHFYDEKGRALGRSRLTEVLPGYGEEPSEGGRGTAGGERPGASSFSHSPALEPVLRKVTQEKMTAYSEEGQTAKRGISIHIHEEVARRAGFKGTLAQGLMSADYISELMVRAFGSGWIQGGKLSLKFIAPVYAGDTITAQGVVKGQTPEREGQRVLVETWCENQTGQRVAVGTASALLV